MGVRSCTRREFLGRIGVGTASAMAAACLSSCRPGGEEKALRRKADEKKPTHIVTLSFDDGFRKSSIRTAEIYEKYKLSGSSFLDELLARLTAINSVAVMPAAMCLI